MEISESIKRFRTEKGLTQKEIADAIKITVQAYQKYEYGTTTPSVKVLKDLADAFGVSADYLLGRTDRP